MRPRLSSRKASTRWRARSSRYARRTSRACGQAAARRASTPAMRSECCSRRCQSRRRPRSRVRGRRCCARERERRDAPAPGVRHSGRAVAVVHARGAQRAAAQGRRARGARPASASACCRLASAVSGESPDISATRPPSAAVSPPSRSRDPPSRPTRKVSRPASPANVEQCASPLGAWRRYDDHMEAGAVVVVAAFVRASHRRYVINSRQNYSQAAHTRVWGLRRPRAGAARARSGRALDRSPAGSPRAGGRWCAFLPRASCMLRARVPRGAGGVGGASRARPRRRTAPL